MKILQNGFKQTLNLIILYQELFPEPLKRKILFFRGSCDGMIRCLCQWQALLVRRQLEECRGYLSSLQELSWEYQDNREDQDQGSNFDCQGVGRSPKKNLNQLYVWSFSKSPLLLDMMSSIIRGFIETGRFWRSSLLAVVSSTNLNAFNGFEKTVMLVNSSSKNFFPAKLFEIVLLLKKMVISWLIQRETFWTHFGFLWTQENSSSYLVGRNSNRWGFK